MDEKHSEDLKAGDKCDLCGKGTMREGGGAIVCDNVECNHEHRLYGHSNTI